MNLRLSGFIRRGIAVALVGGVALVATGTSVAHASTSVRAVCRPPTCIPFPPPTGPTISVAPVSVPFPQVPPIRVSGQSFTPGGTVDVFFCLDPDLVGTRVVGCGALVSPPADYTTSASINLTICWLGGCFTVPGGYISLNISYPCFTGMDAMVWAQDRQSGQISNMVDVSPPC